MSKAQKQARPPFAFPLCRDSLCNTHSIEYGLGYAPIETALEILKILRGKRYYIELVWQTEGIGNNLPRALLIREEVRDGDEWLSEKLDLGDKPLLDFLAEAFIEYFKESKGICTYSGRVPLDLVLPDYEMIWHVKSIDFGGGEIHLTNIFREAFTYPIPQDISPYSDVKVGDTGVEWGTLMKAAAILFFTKEAGGHEVLIDIINRRIMDKFGVVVYSVSIPLSRIKITGKELVFMSFQQGLWRERSNPNLSVGVASVNTIYLPAKFWGRGQYVPLVIEYKHEFYVRTGDAYLYWRPNDKLVFSGLEGLTYRIEANVRAIGNRGIRLALDENTWIRILKWSRDDSATRSTGRGKRHREIVSFYPILHLSIHEDKSSDSFIRVDFPISAIKLMIERFSPVRT